MSYTTVILCHRVSDHDTKAMREILATYNLDHWPIVHQPLDINAGIRAPRTTVLYVGMLRAWMVTDLVTHIARTKWCYPLDVQIFAKGKNDAGFMEIT